MKKLSNTEANFKKVLLIKKVYNSLIFKVVTSSFKFHLRNEMHFPFLCFKSAALCMPLRGNIILLGNPF